MSIQALILLAAFLAVLLVLAWPLGIYLEKIGDGSAVRGLGWVAKLENFLYRSAGTSAQAVMGWKTYAIALLVFNAQSPFQN
ncbi:MAG: potassium-transporting ATPase subunit KdpA [Burkholderiaceae bacterium]|jgi:K+-transporting ATPase ATPase A chain